MDNKKTFGAYILQRRRELGMTQKEFAEKLYVTESAVSKWERGLSYPDITLLLNICSVLDISEHELLTGSEDIQARNAEKLASKYLLLSKRYRLILLSIYGLTLLGCAIGNLAAQHTLDWFFIVLSSVLVAASLTLVPVFADMHQKTEKLKAPLTVLSFTLSLELLLLVCCLYTGGDWFWVAGVSVLLGLSLVLLPLLLPGLPLPACFEGRRTSLYLLTETALLLLLLFVCQVYTGGYWFIITAVSVLFGLGFFILPVLLRQLPLPEPLCRHKTALYFAVQTLLLILLLFIADSRLFLTVGLPVSLLCLILPWALMAVIRYLPFNGLIRAGLCFGLTGLWTWLFPAALEFVLSLRYGPADTAYALNIPFDFSHWGGNQTAMNVIAIVLFSFAALSAAFLIAGIALELKRRRK